MSTHASATSLWCTKERDHEHESFAHHHLMQLAHRLWLERRNHIDEVFTKFRRVNPPRTILAHSCDHFRRPFPLNQLLVLLLLAWAKQPSVTGIEHVPNARLRLPIKCAHAGAAPTDCYGTEHDITCTFKRCDQETSDEVLTARPELVLLRHGIDPAYLFPEFADTDRQTRQVVPMHLAHLRYNDVARAYLV